jgi:SAM-dependent methyltransferase
MALEDVILLILTKAPTDQYGLFKQAGNASISEITKALATLEQRKAIHVFGYRRSMRSGLDIPIYAPGAGDNNKFDVHPLLAGVTSERLVEYDFVARNLLPKRNQGRILEVGSAGSNLARSIREFGRGKFLVIGIDLAREGSDTRMDARSTGFRSETFDQVISISTIEHVGLCCGINDRHGDSKVIQEIFRLLKKGGSAIISVPYGRTAIVKQEFRVYDRNSLNELAKPFSLAKKEFYRYSSGKWQRCSQDRAGRVVSSDIPPKFHSAACVCLLLKKKHWFSATQERLESQ